jgi:AraC-like DNA-binding protein
MSIAAYKAVWNFSKATGGAKLLLLALAEHADSNGRCWPGIGRLSDMVGTSERHIKRLLKELEGLCELEIKRATGRGYTSEYRITLPLERVTSEAERVTPMSPIDEPERVTSEAERVTSEAERVTSEAGKGDAHVTPTVSDPSVEPSEEPEEEPNPFPFQPSPVRPAVLSPAEERVQAILAVCGLDPDVPAHVRLAENAAVQLRSYAPGYIVKRYAPNPSPNGDWHWYRDDWRGARGDMPTPAQVVDAIAKRRIEPPPGNTSAPPRQAAPAEAAALEYARRRQELMNQ